jgi:hypothetical protein
MILSRGWLPAKMGDEGGCANAAESAERAFSLRKWPRGMSGKTKRWCELPHDKSGTL